MRDQAVAKLLPTLVRHQAPVFNVFDVMHHGTHEKQLSNLFAWLLDAAGTHGLGDVFQRIFVGEVNRGLPDGAPVPDDDYTVLQEVNTSAPGSSGADIADLVLESDTTVLVVENYYTSDGHGHDYAGYQSYGARQGKRSVVVMLCGTQNPLGLQHGWEHSAVVTHARLVEQLTRHVGSDDSYQESHPQQCVFFDHMNRHFVGGQRVSDDVLIHFIDAMCSTGEAEVYGRRTENAPDDFADRLRQLTLEQYRASRELLWRVKAELRAYCAGNLRAHVNATLGQEAITGATANYQGKYEWTVNLQAPGHQSGEEAAFAVKFGPSAWYANEADPYWTTTVDPSEADYTHLFVTRLQTREIRQSAVTMKDVLDGLSANDRRLPDEIAGLLRGG